MADWFDKLQSDDKEKTAEIVPEVVQPTPQQTNVTQDPKQTLIASLFEEVKCGNIVRLMHEIETGNLEPDVKMPDGYTLLHIAVERSDFELMAKVIDELKISMEIGNNFEQTPFILATLRGNLPVMKFLLDKGANIEARDNRQNTPLIVAVQYNHLDAVLVLISQGARLDAKDVKGGSVAHWAAYKNNANMLRLFNIYGVDLTEPDSDGMTPLHRAVSSNARQSIQYLRSQRVPEDVKSNEQITPLEFAQKHEMTPALQALDSNGPSNWVYNNSYKLFFTYYALIYFVYVVYILPYTAQYLIFSLLFNCTTLAVPIFGFLVHRTDQGTVPKSTEKFEGAVLIQIQAAFMNEEWTQVPHGDSICYTCYLKRPLRSKHCSVCDRWTPQMDHHSLLFGKCISDANHKNFVGFLGSLYFSTSLFIYLETCMYDEILQEAEFAPYVVKSLVMFFTGPPVNIAAVFLALALGWYVFWYLMLEVFCISTGVTVNEAFNRHRYRYLFTPFRSIDKTIKLRYNNKFNKGIGENWSHFLTK